MYRDKIADYLDGTDHSAFLQDWVNTARKKLIDKKTGLLVSQSSFHGVQIEGPEGSTIWVTIHFLRLIDEDFAKEQYLLAKKHLRRSLFWFGYAREWPDGHKGHLDIDSGIVIPIMEGGIISSGLTFVAASSFKDTEFLSEMWTTLNLIGFPIEEDGILRFGSSNQLGDAALLFSMVLGPAWERIKNAKRD